MVVRIALVLLALLVAVPGGSYLWTRVKPHTVRSEILIDASPERVWRVLSDLPAYREWNPFMTEAAGTVKVGEQLTVKMTDGKSATTFTPKVLVAKEGQELRWIGRFLMPGVADGEHSFRLEAVGGKTKLVQEEKFVGALVPFAGGALDVADEFAAMNAALKARVEKMP